MVDVTDAGPADRVRPCPEPPRTGRGERGTVPPDEPTESGGAPMGGRVAGRGRTPLRCRGGRRGSAGPVEPEGRDWRVPRRGPCRCAVPNVSGRLGEGTGSR
ncbi:hypothetical protein GCM10010330_32080 [Streptomyces tendae]|nr:hypothetical protein GCM10010330_32080 [Streptomyces tendae]